MRYRTLALTTLLILVASTAMASQRGPFGAWQWPGALRALIGAAIQAPVEQPVPSARPSAKPPLRVAPQLEGDCGFGQNLCEQDAGNPPDTSCPSANTVCRWWTDAYGNYYYACQCSV